MSIGKKQILVVLGVHRSGTSALTRALTVLGAEVGDNLMPPVVDNNPTGFWEDVDINALNDEMLKALRSGWDSVAPIPCNAVESLKAQGFFLKAVELLSTKVSGKRVFAFKDPRVAKLLPFWSQVFGQCQVDVGYVLSIRHPTSVVASLAKRDGFDREKSYLLWMGHVLWSLLYSQGAQRVLVDYDVLMRSPESQLDRVADSLGLSADPAEKQRYLTEFLDQSLQHSMYQLDDLRGDSACPPLVTDMYEVLTDVARDAIGIDDPGLAATVEGWAAEFSRCAPLLVLTDKLVDRTHEFAAQVQALQGSLVRTQDAGAQALVDKERELAAYAGQAQEFAGQVQALQGQLQLTQSAGAQALADKERELAAYAEQAQQFAAQVRAQQDHLLRLQDAGAKALADKEHELAAYAEQTQEFAAQALAASAAQTQALRSELMHMTAHRDQAVHALERTFFRRVMRALQLVAARFR